MRSPARQTFTGGSMNYAGRLEKVSASVARWKSLLGLTNVLRRTLGLAPAAYDDYGHGTHVAVGVCVFASFAFPRLVNPLRTSERRYSNPLT
jgi:hypothetical protein